VARKLKVAIVHDWLVSPGGAERTVLAIHDLWPDAPVYTAAYDPDKFPEFKDLDVRPTWLNKIALAKRKHQLFSIPRAWAFKMLDLSEYDVVISSASAESKYVHTGKNTLHICYCHTPIRYYWSDYDWYRQHPPFGALNPVAKYLLPVMIPFLRRMDYKGAQRVDQFIANSDNVKKRIEKYYDRDATVIYPPIQTKRFKVYNEPGEYYLVFGRQVAYKRLDLAVDAFNELGLPLVVAGTGEEIAIQKPRSKANIKYLGRVDDKDVPDLFGKAIAFVFPAEEDFGMVNVEAQAAGRPVIAYGKGGACESVIEGVTGTFFLEQTPDSLVEAVKRFQDMKFDPKTIRNHAENFDEDVFKSRIKEFVENEYAKFKGHSQ
jgi:glycosyltransferase involved in cell wall biosynthesis